VVAALLCASRVLARAGSTAGAGAKQAQGAVADRRGRGFLHWRTNSNSVALLLGGRQGKGGGGGQGAATQKKGGEGDGQWPVGR
jgi:hypothetical protein